ncbi:lipopolysaccharide biosynthesis protein [Clostridium drakei]|uniref:Polysaccharide biosynthesis protein n=1 Tax=Clostridium drakei TaxID=332101 RepID=A0A2U8DV96_9CLOT|nr:oligosaccharide flippase family protein [Clostridium drakei]AWI06381.1 polysaccharide biosynthesis protein [Clostridium drakei]
MKFERTKNSSRNIIYGIANRIVSILFPFIIRTIIIKVLGEEYLGLNSLFASILQVLNLSELGFGTAMIFSMYEPIAKDNEEEICALLNLYRKIYRLIGVGILFVGLSLLPFIKYIISGSYPKDINIYFLYFLYLVNTSISYLLFAYKKSLLTAHQRSDLIEKVGVSVRIVISIIQLILLIEFKSFILYVISNIVCTVTDNIICSILVDRRYPQYRCRGILNKAVTLVIAKRVGALAFQKIGNTVSTSLDNIIISAFLGLSTVGIYGNYCYIISAITAFLTLIYGAITAGIGNSIIVETKEKNYRDFNKLTFINAWIVGWCSICLVCLYQPFMMIWVGSSLMLEFTTVILLVAYFYITLIRKIVQTYKDADGMWWEDKFRPLVGCGINLIFNIVLVSKIGINGVIISTIISYFFIEMPWETNVLFKNYFQKSELIYYFKLVIYTVVICLVGALTYYVCSMVPGYGVICFISKIIVCVIIPNVIFLIISFRSTEFQYVFGMAKRLIIKKKLA